MVNGLLQEIDPEVFNQHTIAMNFYSDGSALQAILEIPLQKQTGTMYAPPLGKRLIYFVDDLNLPQVDPYNTQSGISLLRQYLDYGH